MALAVTETLKDLDPEDPVRYDFAICRLGILDACPSRRDPIKCSACDLREICTLPAAAVGCPAAAAATAPAPGF
jgi:hypothetical protein